MKVLGIDPGSINCGYSIIANDNGRPEYIECGVLHARAGLPKWERILIIGNDLRALLSEHKWGLDDQCAVESAYVPVGRGMKGVEALAETRGALCYIAMAYAGLGLTMVAPSTVKKAVTGNGRSDKSVVGEYVRGMLRLKSLPPPDATDALAVAIAVANGAGK